MVSGSRDCSTIANGRNSCSASLGAEIESAARDLMTQKYSIHFHCWDKSALRGFLESARGYFGNIFSIVDFRPNGPETVMVIKRET